MMIPMSILTTNTIMIINTFLIIIPKTSTHHTLSILMKIPNAMMIDNTIPMIVPTIINTIPIIVPKTSTNHTRMMIIVTILITNSRKITILIQNTMTNTKILILIFIQIKIMIATKKPQTLQE